MLDSLIKNQQETQKRLASMEKSLNALVKLNLAEQKTQRTKDRREASLARRAKSDKGSFKEKFQAKQKKKKEEKDWFSGLKNGLLALIALPLVVKGIGVALAGAAVVALSHKPFRDALFKLLKEGAELMAGVLKDAIIKSVKGAFGDPASQGSAASRRFEQERADTKARIDAASTPEEKREILKEEKAYDRYNFKLKHMDEKTRADFAVLRAKQKELEAIRNEETEEKIKAAKEKVEFEELRRDKIIKALKEANKGNKYGLSEEEMLELYNPGKAAQLKGMTSPGMKGWWHRTFGGDKNLNYDQLTEAGYQTGGPITVPGTGSGDKMFTHVLPGSFIMNRNAAGFQTGGVPVMLEPGEHVYGPGQWGPMEMMLNKMIPRFQEGGPLDKMSDKNIKKASAAPGLCVTGSLNTMEKSGVPNPAATGKDQGNNPRGGIVQLVNSFGWNSPPGGKATTLKSPYGTANVNVLSASEYQTRIKAGGVPSGSMIFQTRHDDWNGTSPASRGYDMAIAQKNGGALWNGQALGSMVYGNTKKVIQLTPGGTAPTVKPGQVEGGHKLSPETPGMDKEGGIQGMLGNILGGAKEGLKGGMYKAGLPGLYDLMEIFVGTGTEILGDMFGAIFTGGSNFLSGFADAAMGKANASEMSPGGNRSGGGPSSISGPKGSGSFNNNFKGFYEMAKKSGAKYPELVAAQWQLESASGTALSGTHNYFGIKAAAGEKGSTKSTWEVLGGKDVTVNAKFKDFSHPQDAVNHLVSQWHKDYKGYKGVNNASDAYAAADMLRSEGYATDPAYSTKLKRIMRENGYQTGGSVHMSGAKSNNMARFSQAQQMFEKMAASSGEPIIVMAGGGGAGGGNPGIDVQKPQGTPGPPNLPDGPQVVALLELTNRLAMGANI